MDFKYKYLSELETLPFIQSVATSARNQVLCVGLSMLTTQLNHFFGFLKFVNTVVNTGSVKTKSFDL